MLFISTGILFSCYNNDNNSDTVNNNNNDEDNTDDDNKGTTENYITAAHRSRYM